MATTYRIYCYTNQITGQKYVGCTKLSEYIRAGKDGHKYIRNCSIFGQAIIDYGWNNFVYSVLEDNLTKEQSQIRERYWIDNLETTFPNGYNLQSGGWKGRKLHESTKEKLSNSMKGTIPYNKGGSSWNKGIPMREETKKIQSEHKKLCHWYTNGTKDVFKPVCPEGFWPGRIPWSKKKSS